MASDILSFMTLMTEYTKVIRNIYVAPHEILAYSQIYRMVSGRFTFVNSIRNSTFGLKTNAGWIDAELQEIKVSLKRSEEIMKGVADGGTSWTSWTSAEDVGIPECIRWCTFYRKIAAANRKLLRLCDVRLGNIREKLERENEMRSQLPETIYFQETEEQLWVVLSKRIQKNSRVNSGRGEQLSKYLAKQ